MDPVEFRRIMGHFVTGVTIVTSRDPGTGAPCGLTANTFTSVSLEPTLVLTCVDREADSHDCIAEAGYFAINLLPVGEEDLSRRFATMEMEAKFSGVAHRTEVTGAPILEAAMGWLDCRVWATYPGGDHTIFVGEVLAGDAYDEAPLIYYRGDYGRLAP
jgi:flavin reductase (DIM6/NTAB) family NADH-FMN oxidoreductase RutF